MKQSKQNLPSRKRDRLTILTESLQIALYGAKKTQIIYKANLSFKLAQKYLRLMEKTKLITKYFGTQGMIYKTTQKGVDFMIRCLELNFMIENPHKKKRHKATFYSPTLEL